MWAPSCVTSRLHVDTWLCHIVHTQRLPSTEALTGVFDLLTMIELTDGMYFSVCWFMGMECELNCLLHRCVKCLTCVIFLMIVL